MAKITLDIGAEAALRLLIDAANALDAMAVAGDSVEGGHDTVMLAMSAAAAVFDAELFGGRYAPEIRWTALEEEVPHGEE